MLSFYTRFCLAGVCVLSLASACQSHGAPAPAVLANTESETITALKAVLAEAMGRARVELGPGDFTKTSTISVLPPPLAPDEDRSTAQPAQFDLVIDGSRCYVVRRATKEKFPAPDVPCVRANR